MGVRVADSSKGGVLVEYYEKSSCPVQLNMYSYAMVNKAQQAFKEVGKYVERFVAQYE